MQTQIITEAGTVIGIYDPKDEHPHLSLDSEISKNERGRQAIHQPEWDRIIQEKLDKFNAKVKAASTPPEAKRSLKKVAVDALPKSGAGKAALVGVPATAALLASETNRAKLKAKYDASRDVRHYRPASPYYDDGFGKAALPPWLKPPKGQQTLRAKAATRAQSAPRAAYEKLAGTADAPGPGRKAARTLENPAVATTALSAAATGVTAAAGAVKAARASRKAAKLKAIQDARRRQNIRDAAVVGAVAAPVALGTRLATRKKDSDVEKSDELITKGPVKALKRVWKNPSKNSNMAPRDRAALAMQKLKDPKTYEDASSKIADMSGDAARTSTNVRSVIEDAKKALIPKSMQKPQGMSMGQKAAIGGAGVGGLLVGRELSGPKPYPYQQQR